MARKKIVLVIVEGVSDDTALGVALNQVYDKDAVHIEILHGDITTKEGIISQNVVSKIGNIVKAFAKAHRYKSSDFKQIIHLVDTDGVYIPTDNIYEDPSLDILCYEDDGIYTNSIDRVVKRNRQKRENLYRLRTTGTIWKVPYRVYYMSCNLDHVLHDKRNSSDEEKEDDAYAFAKRYKDDVNGFVGYMCNSTFSVNMSFKDSWRFIEDGMNSINRHTNFNICIEEEIKMQEEKKRNILGKIEEGPQDVVDNAK